jgi:putative transposase
VEFIASQRTTFGIPHAIACRALGVLQSWFYKWINRKPTARRQRRDRLDEEIKRLFTALGGTYGSPRITDNLRAAGWKVSVNTVAARMAELGLAGRPPKRRRSLTRQGQRPAAPDLVRRKFAAVAPGRAVVWRRHADRHRPGTVVLGRGGGPVFTTGARPRHVRPS